MLGAIKTHTGALFAQGTKFLVNDCFVYASFMQWLLCINDYWFLQNVFAHRK